MYLYCLSTLDFQQAIPKINIFTNLSSPCMQAKLGGILRPFFSYMTSETSSNRLNSAVTFKHFDSRKSKCNTFFFSLKINLFITNLFVICFSSIVTSHLTFNMISKSCGSNSFENISCSVMHLSPENKYSVLGKNTNG